MQHLIPEHSNTQPTLREEHSRLTQDEDLCFIPYRLSLSILRYTCSKGFNLCGKEKCQVCSAPAELFIRDGCWWRSVSLKLSFPTWKVRHLNSDSWLLCSIRSGSSYLLRASPYRMGADLRRHQGKGGPGSRSQRVLTLNLLSKSEPMAANGGE